MCPLIERIPFAGDAAAGVLPRCQACWPSGDPRRLAIYSGKSDGALDHTLASVRPHLKQRVLQRLPIQQHTSTRRNPDPARTLTHTLTGTLDER